ncbi:hypothetical protein AQPE_3732 [Aquipluma nitroreducens]|uniref:Uncharacterized protein n=1 Tax=Aquipluma nitroreducens TaxID=2010828 RepID=A0A5K7SDM5_9BACT|nr:hypothetical protein AQPE_3732 [Aquipluma nitroreducens]
MAERVILQINCLNLGNELRKQGSFGYEMYLNKQVRASL